MAKRSSNATLGSLRSLEVHYKNISVIYEDEEIADI